MSGLMVHPRKIEGGSVDIEEAETALAVEPTLRSGEGVFFERKSRVSL
jgi:hypothetical protein